MKMNNWRDTMKFFNANKFAELFKKASGTIESSGILEKTDDLAAIMNLRKGGH